MALNHQIRPVNRINMVQPARHPVDAVETDELTTPGNYTDTTALNARLTALGYSNRRISQLSLNDKIFIVKSTDDPLIGDQDAV